MANIHITIPDWLDKLCSWPVTAYRKHKYGYPYRRIFLGENLFTIVDPQDFYWANNYHWSLKQNGKNTYAVRLVADSKNKTRILSLHREIMNNPKGRLVDHKSGLGLDNRRENLRVATHSQNQCNKGKTRKNSSSRFLGVFLEKRSKKWCARIAVNSKKFWLGRFTGEIDAAKAYDKAAMKYHGEFARFNFSQDNV